MSPPCPGGEGGRGEGREAQNTGYQYRLGLWKKTKEGTYGKERDWSLYRYRYKEND